MKQPGSRDQWVNELDTNEHGRKILTFSRSLELATDGRSSGWFVGPYATQWAVGREAEDGERYYLLRASGEPVVFGCRHDAQRFLKALLELSAACPDGLEQWAQRVARSFIAATRAVVSGNTARHAPRPA